MRRLTLLAIVASLVVTACSQTSDASEPIDRTTSAESNATSTSPTQEHGVFVGADGVATTITDTSRIASLTGDITEIIFALGLGDDVVAVDITTTYPPEADDLRRSGASVGFGQALAPESVLQHEPTLVIGDESIQPTETIEQLRAAGVPVVILEYRSTMAGVEAKIHEVAGLLGVEDSGDELAKRVMSEVASAQDKIPPSQDQPRVAYLYTRGPSVLLLFGNGIPTQAMIEGAGAVDVGAEIGEGAIPLTPEAIVAAAPDVIVLPQSGVDGLGGFDALLEIPGIAETPAGRNLAFLAYDEAYFFNLGPRVGMALNEFVDDLYPDPVD